MAITSGNPQVESSEYSVGELLSNRSGGDRWHLALVQRDEVWDVERMGLLLDSLLAGYPVGALLLCRTDKESSKVIDRDGDEKTVREAPEGAPTRDVETGHREGDVDSPVLVRNRLFPSAPALPNRTLTAP
jgi:hypothetical protein